MTWIISNTDSAAKSDTPQAASQRRLRPVNWRAGKAPTSRATNARARYSCSH